MARVTIDDCLEKIPNRFMLVIAAAKRARQLHQGAQPLVRCKNKEAVTALREIAAGFVEVVLPEASRHSPGQPSALPITSPLIRELST